MVTLATTFLYICQKHSYYCLITALDHKRRLEQSSTRHRADKGIRQVCIPTANTLRRGVKHTHIHNQVRVSMNSKQGGNTLKEGRRSARRFHFHVKGECAERRRRRSAVFSGYIWQNENEYLIFLLSEYGDKYSREGKAWRSPLHEMTRQACGCEPSQARSGAAHMETHNKLKWMPVWY